MRGLTYINIYNISGTRGSICQFIATTAGGVTVNLNSCKKWMQINTAHALIAYLKQKGWSVQAEILESPV